MQLERIDRWVWVVLSLAVGACLAWARSGDDHADLQARLGHGVAEQAWFEREVVRKVATADGSFVRGFDRLTVFPSSVVENGRRRPVHLVAGMALARAGDNRAGAAPGFTGTLRPCFFVAPVPFTPLASRGNDSAKSGRTVVDYLDTLASRGVSYRYAWWADSRYRTAAWVGGSFVLVGVLWPTAVNLLAYGSFRRPPRERGTSLWRVRRPRTQPTQRPSYAVDRPADLPPDPAAPSAATGVAGDTGSAAVPSALPLARNEPEDATAPAHKDQKQFGASANDFYPTELKLGHERAV